MKRIILAITVCIFIAFSLLILSACNTNSGDANKDKEQENYVLLSDTPDIKDLDEVTVSQIKNDYKDYIFEYQNITADIEDISIIGYYGTYSGHYEVTSIAVMFQVRGMEYLEVKHEFLIGGTTDNTRFIYPDSNAIMIWCIPYNTNITINNIHKMQRAFGYGFLTSNEVKAIGALHEAENEDYYTNNRFNIDKENQIKQDFYYKYGMDETWSYAGVEYSYTYDDVYILKYCGEYLSGAASFYMTASCFDYAQVLTSEYVGGLTFNYSDANHIKVWYEGDFYSLGQAYTQGLLTYDELLITHALFNA